MKPEFVCDNCLEDLKEKMEEEEMEVYIIPDRIGGFSVMKHHNCPKYVVLCEECEEEAREKLKENECWHDLEEWDMFGEVKEYFNDFNKLVDDINKLANKK